MVEGVMDNPKDTHWMKKYRFSGGQVCEENQVYSPVVRKHLQLDEGILLVITPNDHLLKDEDETDEGKN